MPAEAVARYGYYVLWVAAPLLLGATVWLLRRRRLQGEFPFFYRYLIVQAVVNAVLLLVVTYGSYKHYFYTYWVSSAAITVLEFAVIYEVFRQISRPYPYLRDFARVLFRWAGTLLLFIAMLFGVTATSQDEPIVTAVLWAQRSVRLVQCGLVFFLLYFCSYLGITRRHYLFGVALGFGTIASAEVALYASRIATGLISDRVFNLILMAVYDWAVVIWLMYFRLRPAPATASASGVPIHAGVEWDRGVAELLYPASAEPGLLARIDKMVEVALSQPRGEAEKAKAAAAATAVSPHPPTPLPKA